MYLDGNFVVAALGALVCIPAAKGLMDVIYPYFVSNVAAGLELSFPPQLYAVIYAGVLACYLLIDLVLVRRLDRMTPAEVLKNREKLSHIQKDLRSRPKRTKLRRFLSYLSYRFSSTFTRNTWFWVSMFRLPLYLCTAVSMDTSPTPTPSCLVECKMPLCFFSTPS